LVKEQKPCFSRENYFAIRFNKSSQIILTILEVVAPKSYVGQTHLGISDENIWGFPIRNVLQNCFQALSNYSQKIFKKTFLAFPFPLNNSVNGKYLSRFR